MIEIAYFSPDWFLSLGGAVYYHSPIQPEPLRSGCHVWSTYGNFVADQNFNIKAHTAQYYASRLINLEWVKHGAGIHRLAASSADLKDAAGHVLITSYAVLRPDENWSLMLVNKDQFNSHAVRVIFDADSLPKPNQLPAASTISSSAATTFTLPKASITVLRGRVETTKR
jgi:hypothetical protein